MTSNSKLEAVAEALHHCDQQEGALPCAYKDLSKHKKRWFEGLAQAAITAYESALSEENARLRGVLKLAAPEIYWLAVQKGLDWKDKEWVAKSSVGRAYTAIQQALTGKDGKHE